MSELTFTEWLTAVGIVLFILAVIWLKWRKELKFIFQKKEADGTIINWLATKQDGRRVYYPMIQMDLPGKAAFTFRAEEMCEGQPMYEVGTRVKVLYLAEDLEVRKVIYPKK